MSDHRIQALVLTCLGLLTLSVVLAVALVTRPTVAPKPRADWIYGTVQRGNTDDPKVQVVCQGKTNSLKFANHVHAEPGDVLIETCRAVKA